MEFSPPIKIKHLTPTKHYLIPQFAEKYMEGVILTEGEINARLEKMVHEALTYYSNEPVILLCLLKGSSRILGDINRLIRRF